jgi:PD-(D/E)XK nuclease superfamily
MTLDRAELTPNQVSILDDLLGVNSTERPPVDLSLAPHLKERLNAGLAPMSEAFGDWLGVGKYALSSVHSCEGRYLAQQQDAFAWKVSNVRGQIVHRAIQASAFLERYVPAVALVDQAIASIRGDDRNADLTSFLDSLSPVDLAIVKGEATDSLVKFASDWPPIDPAWSPRAESSAKVSLCGGAISLRAKYDLVFFQPRRDLARVVIVDFKTGGRYQGYSDDLRFYALVETIRTGVPPFRIASYYVDEGRFAPEIVTEDILESAARRVIDGVRKIVELKTKHREPRLTPSSWCRFCPARDECGPGREYLAASPADGDRE